MENIESFSGKYIETDSVYDLEGSKIANPGDVIFGKLRPYLAKVLEITEKVCVNNEFAIFHGDLVISSYLKYYMLSHGFLDTVTSSTYGTKMPRANTSFISSLPIPLPPLHDQRAIAEYLDAKCSRLDALVSGLEEQIAKLKQYKQSLITETVTKGLNPNAPLKDSGIEWIGEIPEGWEVSRLKFLFAHGKGLPITKENLVKAGVPVISYGQIHSKSNTGVHVTSDLLRFVSPDYLSSHPASLVNRGDFIFADTSEDLDGCGNCAYVDVDGPLFAGYHTIFLQSKGLSNNKYLAYLFLTDPWRSQIRSKVTGIKLFSVSKKILMDTTVILPPASDQRAIAEYLDSKCGVIDQLVRRKRERIEKLGEYKKSLIYEYVTGKKEVPRG